MKAQAFTLLFLTFITALPAYGCDTNAAMRLTASDPGEAAYRVALALCFISNDAPERAYDVLNEANNVIPNNPHICYNLGIVLMNEPYRRYRDAQRYFLEVLSYDSNYYEAYCAAGYIYATAMQNTNKAYECYSRALGLRGDDPQVYNNIGILKISQGEYAGARDDFSNALRLDSSNPDYYYNLGLTYWEQRDWAAANETWNSAAAAFPNDERFVNGAQHAQRELERATRRRGRTQK